MKKQINEQNKRHRVYIMQFPGATQININSININKKCSLSLHELILMYSILMFAVLC